MIWIVAVTLQHALLKLMRSIDNQQLGDVSLVMQQRLATCCLQFMAAVGKKAQDLYSQVNKCLAACLLTFLSPPCCQRALECLSVASCS